MDHDVFTEADHDAFVEELMKNMPDSWDDDSSAESLCIEYVRQLEFRLDEAGGSLERYPEPESHQIEFRPEGWTIQHPINCRPQLFKCPVNRAALDLEQEEWRFGQFFCHEEGGRILVDGPVRSIELKED